MGVGEGAEVAVGLGEAIGAAESAGPPGVAMTLVAGAGRDAQALNRMRDRAIARKSDFMRAIMAET